MYKSAGSGVQNTKNRQCYCHNIDAHGKSDTKLDGLDRGIGQSLEVGQLGNIVAHEDDIGCVHSNIAAQTSHGNANIGGFQSGGIVDTVTDHADSFSALLNLDVPENYLLHFLTGSFAETVKWWVATGMVAEPEAVARYYMTVIKE